MASMQQGEKQLFEKFWRGTFKAVATPRPGSIFVASIIARRTVAKYNKVLKHKNRFQKVLLNTKAFRINYRLARGLVCIVTPHVCLTASTSG
ncbi:UNVERIFIED_CONTAM: hypothetical protein FKN15_055864 [Acipenser sinensis]